MSFTYCSYDVNQTETNPIIPRGKHNDVCESTQYYFSWLINEIHIWNRLHLNFEDLSVYPGGWFNKKMLSYQYRKSHCGDKTILRPSYLHNGISYTGKMTSLYWIRAQKFWSHFEPCLWRNIQRSSHWHYPPWNFHPENSQVDIKHPQWL